MTSVPQSLLDLPLAIVLGSFSWLLPHNFGAVVLGLAIAGVEGLSLSRPLSGRTAATVVKVETEAEADAVLWTHLPPSGPPNPRLPPLSPVTLPVPPRTLHPPIPGGISSSRK